LRVTPLLVAAGNPKATMLGETRARIRSVNFIASVAVEEERKNEVQVASGNNVERRALLILISAKPAIRSSKRGKKLAQRGSEELSLRDSSRLF
jgi:hypothetical protein